MPNKPYLRYFLLIDAFSLYKKGEDVYISKKSDCSRLECMYLESSDVKKYAIKYNIKSNKIDFYKLNNFEYDFYKVEISLV